MDAKSMGERLRAARMARGLTQEGLAQQCGVSVTSVNRWENGHTELTLSNAHAAAQATGVTPEWLAFGRGAQPAEASP